MDKVGRSLAILHVFRAPVGGLFRHVVDLVHGQAARGHRVGIVADATTGGERAEAVLAELKPLLALGIARLPMSRHLGPSDFAAVRRVRRLLDQTGADVVHGHGAKGGAYARLTGGRAARAYTPHGGTLHFDPRSPLGLLYLRLERFLMPRTDLILFESAYARDLFHARIGAAPALERVVHNGLAAAEFAPVAPAADAADIVFVGELRTLKGVDVLIEALALVAVSGPPVSATIVGSGPDADALASASGPLPTMVAVTGGPETAMSASASISTSTPLSLRSSPTNTISAASAAGATGANSTAARPLWTTRSSAGAAPIRA